MLFGETPWRPRPWLVCWLVLSRRARPPFFSGCWLAAPARRAGGWRYLLPAPLRARLRRADSLLPASWPFAWQPLGWRARLRANHAVDVHRLTGAARLAPQPAAATPMCFRCAAPICRRCATAVSRGRCSCARAGVVARAPRLASGGATAARRLTGGSWMAAHSEPVSGLKRRQTRWPSGAG